MDGREGKEEEQKEEYNGAVAKQNARFAGKNLPDKHKVAHDGTHGIKVGLVRVVVSLLSYYHGVWFRLWQHSWRDWSGT